jgi:hypothetical protein
MNTPNVQYIPTHTCPECGAEAITNARGDWFTPWMILGSGSCALDKWQDHIAYVKFNCDCHKYGSMRVARLGDAITPLEFVSIEEAREMGRRPDEINAERTAQAVQYLAVNAAGTGVDFLTDTVYKLVAGSLAPDAALRKIWM